MEFSLDAINKFTDWCARAEKFLSAALAVVLWGVNAYIGVFKEAWRMVGEKIQQLDPGSIGSANFGIIDGIAYINAVFPVSEVVGLYTLYFTAWLCLILIRWVKSFVPTVAN